MIGLAFGLALIGFPQIWYALSGYASAQGPDDTDRICMRAGCLFLVAALLLVLVEATTT